MFNIIISALFILSGFNLFSQNVSTQSATTQKDEKIEKMDKEKEALRSEYELIIQKEKTRIADMEATYNTLYLENKLYAEKMNKELQELKNRLEKISTENKLSEEEEKKALSDISFQISRLKLENDLEAERQRAKRIKMEDEKANIELEIKKMELIEEKIKHEIFLKTSEVEKLKAELDLAEKRDETKKRAKKEIEYTDEILKNGILRISDRRIPLNGVITMKTADYIANRIDYFNNISTAPIFIVIDRSPGGSVMAGYKILKAMEASRAPVYVVVKSYAASMAATITTLAKKSFIYPNAIILHHQMSTMAWGNMTQLKEQLEMARKWEKRLMGPVAKKLGMDIETFRKKMYEHNSDGDWEEFGDDAVNLKWADVVIDRIIEEGIIKDPDYYSDKKYIEELPEKTDEKGKKYVELPRLDPFDFYFLYNPDNYYRYNY
jgi:ATP-dependent Clp protease protease subunit